MSEMSQSERFDLNRLFPCESLDFSESFRMTETSSVFDQVEGFKLSVQTKNTDQSDDMLRSEPRTLNSVSNIWVLKE